jgi:hypothetical protein
MVIDRGNPFLRASTGPFAQAVLSIFASAEFNNWRHGPYKIGNPLGLRLFGAMSGVWRMARRR